jgi:hypothetical protein
MQTEQVGIKPPRYEITDVLQKLGEGVEKIGLNVWQLRTLRQVKNCRTAAMGGHIDACDSCGNISISYNSCRNRHCPKCQGKNREEWIQARNQELLPVPYFHVVFTLPDSINSLAMQPSHMLIRNRIILLASCRKKEYCLVLCPCEKHLVCVRTPNQIMLRKLFE